MIRIKSSVSISGIRPEMVLALIIVDGILSKLGKNTVITSGLDSKHGRGSLHFVGLALDLRTRDMEPNLLGPTTIEIQNALGPEYDIVLEGNHWHIEFQPKKGVNL